MNIENNIFFSGVDTRALTKKIREKGTMLGKVSNFKACEYVLRHNLFQHF